MRVLLHFVRLYPWRSLAVLGCLLASSLLDGLGWSTALPVLNALFTNPADRAPGGYEAILLEQMVRLGVKDAFGPLLAAMVAAFWIKAAVVLLAKSQVGYTVAHVATDLRLRLLRALLGASWGYYTRLPVGRAVNSMATEADRGARSYEDLSRATANGMEAAVALSVAAAISWPVTLAAVGAGLTTVILLGSLVRTAGRAGRKQTDLLQSLLGRLTDVLQAVKLLKATAREPLLGPLLEGDTRKLKKSLRRQVVSGEALAAIQEPLLISFCGAGLLVGHSLGMALPEVLLLMGLFARTLGCVNKGQREVQRLRTRESALWAIETAIAEAEAQEETLGGTAPPHLDSGIALRDVTLAYAERPVLESVSVDIPAGEITALLGASGSGKTTLIDLVTGLVRPQSGEIRIDGTPLSDLDLVAWRRMIGYVPQEMLLLNASVRLNVTLGDPALTDADVEHALRDAEAWEIVAQLPGGIDAPVGERGALLSGGQRQRISIARALVHRPRLLILDEATAALDPPTEAAIWDTVAKLRGRATVIAISHQPALARVADRIYRVEGRGVRRADVAPTASEGAA
jgi:ATP-binding cassette subfamily C protein